VYPRIGSGNFCTRFIDNGTIFDVNAPGCFPDEHIYYLLAFLNSNTNKYFLTILCPTLSFQVGDVSKVPCILKEGSIYNLVESTSKMNISIAAKIGMLTKPRGTSRVMSWLI
jgi:hypothetical protein